MRSRSLCSRTNFSLSLSSPRIQAKLDFASIFNFRRKFRSLPQSAVARYRGLENKINPTSRY